jgi:haloalkane dehalogenase
MVESVRKHKRKLSGIRWLLWWTIVVFVGIIAIGGCSGGDSSTSDSSIKPEDTSKQADCIPDESDVPIHVTEAGLEFVRTPDERFERLPGYPFEPHYVMLDGLRMHYVDEGPPDGEVVLMLHGQPSWSYLYRKMIPIIADAGHRAIAVDHIGMGRSDKPVDLSVHTYTQHIEWTTRFIEELDLQEVTLFCQDWGGLIGLRVVGDHPERFARVVTANTRLPIIPRGFNPFTVPDPVEIDCTLKDAMTEVFGKYYSTHPQRFQAWINYALTAPNLTPSEIVEMGTVNDLTPEEAAAYNAPYPSLIYKAAIRTFPSMIAAVEDENAPAWATLGEFEKPFLSLCGKRDANLGSEAVQNELINHIPGAGGQPHDRLDAAHFIQEDIGENLAERVNEFIAMNPLPT